jgi:hypothetical protein
MEILKKRNYSEANSKPVLISNHWFYPYYEKPAKWSVISLADDIEIKQETIEDIEKISFEDLNFEKLSDFCELEDYNLSSFEKKKCVCCKDYFLIHDLANHQMIDHMLEVNEKILKVTKSSI